MRKYLQFLVVQGVRQNWEITQLVGPILLKLLGRQKIGEIFHGQLLLAYAIDNLIPLVAQSSLDISVELSKESYPTFQVKKPKISHFFKQSELCKQSNQIAFE